MPVVLESPARLSEQLLADTIYASIRSHVGRLADTIQVDCEDEVITLLGTTKSYYHRQLVVYAAQIAAPECQVVDELQVAYPRRR